MTAWGEASAAGPVEAESGSGSDAELERLKSRRLAEMRRNLHAGGGKGEGRATDRPRRSPREALVSVLGHRGTEVLEAAEMQYPAQAPLIVDQLGRMAMAGELPGGLDGGGLLAVFRSVGIYVRLQTKIKVEQDGKMVPLADRLGGDRAGGGGGGGGGAACR